MSETKQVTLNVPKPLLEDFDKYWRARRIRYRSRTQAILYAMEQLKSRVCDL